MIDKYTDRWTDRQMSFTEDKMNGRVCGSYSSQG